jgi:hypothetical protein
LPSIKSSITGIKTIFAETDKGLVAARTKISGSSHVSAAIGLGKRRTDQSMASRLITP